MKNKTNPYNFLLLFLCVQVVACVAEIEDEIGDEKGSSESFSIGFIPDTQYFVSYPTNEDEDFRRVMLDRMFDFFVDKQDDLNLQLVAHLGDMTSDGDNRDNDRVRAQWDVMETAYESFEQAGIPYTVCRGNHDYGPALNDAFPVGYFQQQPHWGGAHRNNRVENSYYVFSAGGQDFIVLVLDYNNNLPNNVEEWAHDVLDRHSDHHGIVISHRLSSDIKNIMKEHDNVFMGIMGHLTKDTHWTKESYGGTTQHYFIFDYQRSSGEGNYTWGSVVKYFTFHPSQNRVNVQTYGIRRNGGRDRLTNDDCDHTSSQNNSNCNEFSFHLDMD